MKYCANCKHLLDTELFCGGCDPVKKTKWEPKEGKIDCEHCKHADKDPEDEPCRECGIDGLSHFEPKEKEEEEMSESLIKDDDYVVKRKTKAQLMEELEQKNAEIAELKKELEKSASHEQYVEVGKSLREVIDGLVEGGLTEDQAMQFLIGVIPLASKFIR